VDFPHVVIARLYEHLEPIDRGERYEDPLQARLDQRSNVGSVTGGGTQLNELGGIAHAFGTQQCVAIFLDGVTLPDEVYETLDFDATVRDLGAAAGHGSYRGFWQGAEETGLFFYGPDAEALFARVEPVLRRLPIGQNARVVVRYGNPNLNPRELRMPRL
jgi:hypothetical protein